MGNFKLTGLPAGTVNGDSVRYEQVIGVFLPLAGGNMTGGINEAISTVASAATPDIWTDTGNVIDLTGTLTITGFAAATQAGARRTLIAAAASSVTAGANLVIDGLASGSTYTFSAKDKLHIIAFTTTQFYGRIEKADGTPMGVSGAKIQDVDASVASNALTVTVNPGTWDFRSTTLTDGTPVTRTLTSAASVAVPDGATLGTVSGQSARLAILAIDNAGTVETAIVNLAGGLNLDETTLISTTAISTGADSANVIYSTTARTNVAYRVVGFIDISEAATGTWATAPTKVQGSGGQAFAALSSLGYGQTVQNVTGSRSIGTTFYNTTGKPIVVAIQASAAATSGFGTMSINGAPYSYTSSAFAASGGVMLPPTVIPAGASYVMNNSFSTLSISTWNELR